MDLFNVMKFGNEETINQAPVVEDGRLLGMISRDRLLHLLTTREELAA